MADKAALSKGSGSHAANHVIVPHNRPNFVRLLDFVSRFTKLSPSPLCCGCFHLWHEYEF